MQHHSKAKLEGAGAPLSRISLCFPVFPHFSPFPYPLLLLSYFPSSPPFPFVPFPLILLNPSHKPGFPFFPRVE